MEKINYIDELTGVYSKEAYEDFIKKIDLTTSEYTVILFDLNNLENCNITYGQAMGDEYITSCAEAIQQSFMMVGNCYRVGGDEFCVIGRNISDETIENCYCMLGAKINFYNLEHPQLRMSVAYGHERYDATLDKGLDDTWNRAEQVMQEKKREMKERFARYL